MLALGVAIAGIGAIAAYFISALVTNWLLVNLSLAGLVFLKVFAGFARAVAAANEVAHPRRFVWRVSVAATLLLTLLVAYPTLAERFRSYPDNTHEELLPALHENSFPLETVDAGSGFDDLQPLRAILEDKRIVALGEASHGTSEFFRMKHRLLEFLVQEMGFQHFGMELSPANGQLLNAYITGETAVLPRVLYWPWSTAEVVEMLDWMRAYNADPASPHQLTFHGIDPIVGQRDARMAENVTDILAQAGPESKIVLWAHNGHIANAAGWMGHDLKQRWGEQAYLLGFEFNHGAFTSRMLTVHTYRVTAASPAYYAHTLAKLDRPILFLDFKTLAQVAQLQQWLAQPQSSRDLQELHAVYRLNPNWYSEHTSWLQLYDGLIYIEESTPAHSLP